MEIIVKKYEHMNRALGKYIRSRKHYEEEMKRGGYVSYDEGQQLAERANQKNKTYTKELSPKAESIIKAARQMKDRKGKVECGSRMMKAMQEVGVNFYNSNVPKHYRKEGGFDASNEEGS